MKVNRIIEDLYDAEAHEAMEAIENQPISLRMNAKHLHLLQALVDRFSRETRGGLGARLLEAAIEQAFEALSPEDRARVGKKADEGYHQFCRDKHASYEFAGMGWWEGLAEAMARADKEAK